MANRNKPISFPIQSGGQLMSRHSHELAGFGNFVIKRDFRRDFDAEIRAEGTVFYQTNFDAVGDQPYPQRQGESETFRPITLLHQARRPNGQTGTIAGTYSTLYRHYASADSAYIEDAETGPYVESGFVVDDYVDDTGDPRYVVEDYFTDSEGGWVVIADGFSQQGLRWEALTINGWSVFNNGYDLPHTYRVEHNVAYPNYEMRDAGIARVGTIAELNGILIGMDVYEFKEGRLAAQMEHEDSGNFTARQHGAMISYPFTAQKSSGGYAVRGTGATGLVTVPNDATLQTYTDGITIEAWVRVSNSASLSKIIDKGDSPGGCFRMKVEGGSLTVAVEMSNNGTISIERDWEYGTDWVHVAMTYDPATATIRLYINGVFDQIWTSELAPPRSMFENTTDVTMADTDGGSHTCDIAELRIWNTVRSAAQILDNISTPLPTNVNLVGYWKFDDGTGTTATDDSGNGNDGSLGVGASWVASEAPPDSYIEITPVNAATNGLTRSGSTATFIGTSPHKYTTGQLVKISGAAGAEFNGIYAVTVTDTLTFQYTISGTPSTPDAGTPKAQRALFGTDTYNYDAMVGKRFFMFNGYAGEITSIIDPVKVKVDSSVSSLTTASMFQVINETTQSNLSGTFAKNGTTTVTGTSTLFTDELWPGASILIPGGAAGDEIRIVSAIASNTSLTVTAAFSGTASGQAGKLMSDNLVISDDDYFTEEMEGRYLFFDDGRYRRITEFVDERWCRVFESTAVNEQGFALENITAYDAVVDPAKVQRIQYKRVWSDIDNPLRFAASTPASMTVGSRVLRLAYQRKSISSGDELLIVGAGTAGGNLTATVVWAHPDAQTFYLDRPAETSVDEEVGLVARSDAAGSTAGFDELQDDSSAIIKAMEVGGVLITCKESSFYLTRYTGVAADPFANELTCKGKDITSRALHYRNTLTRAGLRSLVYAGKDEFYEYNLINREPVIFKGLAGSSDSFFRNAELADTNSIFAASNVLTQEIFFCFPSDGEDKALVYDTKWGTQRTTGDAYTAMESINRPNSSISASQQEDWVILGDSSGRVLRYGLASGPQAEWGGRKAIYSRLGSSYTSRMKSGLIGDRFFETEMTEWMGELATQDYPTVTQFTFNLYGWRNAAEQPPRTLTSKVIAFPNQKPHVPMKFLAHYFQDEIVVTGVNNPLRIIARTAALSKKGGRVQQKFGNY